MGKRSKAIDLETLRGKVFTCEGVAEILGLNSSSIRRKIREEGLPARQVPGDAGYTIVGAELVEYLQGETKREARQRAREAAREVKPGEDFYKLPKAANRRFKEWFEAQGVMIKDIAEATGLGGDKLSRIISGKRAITRATLDKLEAAYGKGLTTYLITGERD